MHEPLIKNSLNKFQQIKGEHSSKLTKSELESLNTTINDLEKLL